MILPLAFTVLVAFPDFSPPERLADLDSTPRTLDFEVLAATQGGALLLHGGLWWYPLDGATVFAGRVDAIPSVRALGDRFVVLESAQARVIDTSVNPPSVTVLVQAATQLQFVTADSTDAVWFFDLRTVWMTDGTVDGTRVVASGAQVGSLSRMMEVQHRLGGFAGTQFVVWDQDGGRQSTQAADSATTTENGFIVAGGGNRLHTESGTQLSDLDCSALSGGGWASCLLHDGGQAVLSTDGTPAGTVLRDEGTLALGPVRSDQLVYVRSTLQNSQLRALAHRSGSPVVLDAPNCFSPALAGAFAVCSDGLAPLDGRPFAPLGMVTSVAARGPSQLFVHTDRGVELSDGTVSGRRLLRDFRVTESSRPTVLSSDGVAALVRTTNSGVWLTDGTPEGTTRVGDEATRWGSGALGKSGAGFSGFDSHAQRVELPPGVVGASGDWAFGLEGCDAFRVDQSGTRRKLETGGCVGSILTFDDAAWVTRTDGQVWLVRAPAEPIALSNVDVTRAPRCGKKRCWFVSTPGSDDTLTLSSVRLETREVTKEETVPAANGLQLDGANDALLLFDTTVGSTRASFVRVQGVKTLEAGLTQTLVFAFNESELVTGSFSVTRTNASGAQRLVESVCPAAALHFVGDSIAVRCTSGSLRFIDANDTVSSPAGTFDASASDGKLLWLGSAGRLLVSDLDTTKVLGNPLVAREFAVVRAGVVFSAPDADADVELWVVRYARSSTTTSGCGCSSAESALALLGLAMFTRRARRPRRLHGVERARQPQRS